MEPKFKIGDIFYLSQTDTEKRQYDCPDCLGQKVMRVIAPSGDEFTCDCPRCASGWRSSDSKIPSLSYTHHVPKVVECPITGYTVNAYGSGKIEYGSSPRSGSSWTVEEDKIITDLDIALRIAQEKADEANAKQNASPERMLQQHFKDLKMKEAADDMFANGLYESWSGFRHLREGVDDVIGEEGENMSAAEIREALEERLGDTHRYEFVFKGFVRFMETVSAALAGDDEAKALMSERWEALPERLRKVWKSQKDAKWTGEKIPSF